MDQQTYVIKRDRHNRLCAELDQNLTIAIQFLSESDPRRMDKGIHGFAVLTVNTCIGPLVVRSIHIVKGRQSENDFYIRWPKHFVKGLKPKGSDPTPRAQAAEEAKARNEWLDVVGPLDQTTRANFQQAIIGLFNHIRSKGNTQPVINRRPGRGDHGVGA